MDIVTQDMIVALMEIENSDKPAPWNKPWSGTGKYVVMGANKFSVTNDPRNIGSPKRVYSHVLNWHILDIVSRGKGYKTNFWITPDRIKKVGATLKKGSKCVSIFKILENGAISPQPLHHIEEVKEFEHSLGLSVIKGKSPEKQHFVNAKKFAKKLKSKMNFHKGGEYAYYHPLSDIICMPCIEAFVEGARECGKDEKNAEAHYWATFFHESIHWTGHRNRLKRFSDWNNSKEINREHYPKEELVAEMGAAFLCARFSIRNELQHLSYIKHWIDVLNSGGKGKTHPLIKANQDASKATKYLIDLVAGRKKSGKEEMMF